MGIESLLGLGGAAASAAAPAAKAGIGLSDIGTGLAGAGSVVGGISQLTQQPQRPGVQQQSIDVPQAPGVMPLPQLGVMSQPQDLLASLQQINGGR